MMNSNMVAMGLGAMFGGLILFFLAFWVLEIIACWKVFTKAGQPGWKAIIPIYNTYILYKISWKKGVGMFWITIALAIVSLILSATGNAVAVVFSGIISIALIVIAIIQCVKLSKAYGHGGGYAVGLIFLQPFFTMGLGFGSSVYQGPQD